MDDPFEIKEVNCHEFEIHTPDVGKFLRICVGIFFIETFQLNHKNVKFIA